MRRRTALVGLGAILTSACSKIANTATARQIFQTSESWHEWMHRRLAGRELLAPEYQKSDISPVFRGNGSTTVNSAFYKQQLDNGFADWKLEVCGLVDKPITLTLAELHALPQRTQITRHDCVEGWSAIGEWKGPRLSTILNKAAVRSDANFIVFHCADSIYGKEYYESIDMIDAFHEQTIIAHELNGQPLPEENGAPLRMRIERQIGYKHPKYLTRIEAVASLEEVHGGQGGYWEDNYGYQWYAGL